MILSDVDIRREIDNGNLVIDPPIQDEDYSPSSIDIHLGEEIRTFKPSHDALRTSVDLSHPELHTIFDEITDSVLIPTLGYTLQSGEFILAWTKEHVTLPATIGARLEGRSTIARFGICIHSTAPTIHPTFSGNLRLEVSNQGKLPCILYTGLAIGQLVFERLESLPSKALQSKWQGQKPVGS